MKRATSLVLVVLMLVSVLAGLNPIEMNENEPVDGADGRADYEVELIGANSPRESTQDFAGTVRNAVDVNESVTFDLVIQNTGANSISEMNIRVRVSPSGENMPTVIDNFDAAICDDNTVCNHLSLASGNYLANGRYEVRTPQNTTLTWAPPAPGSYDIIIDIDAGDQDTDLTNNQLAYTVIATDWYDIGVELEWDATGTDDPVTGEGPHAFTLTAMVNGSSEWQPRDVQLELTMSGSFMAMDASGNPASFFDYDNDGSQDACPADPCTFTMTFGELYGYQQAEDIEVYSNMSMDPPSIVNASDLNETRLVPNFQQPYTFTGSIKADTDQANGVGAFEILASVKQYSIYTMVSTDYGGGQPGNGSTGGSGSDVVNEMMETNETLDDDNGNNDALLAGSFAAYHDIRITDLQAGLLREQGGRLTAGMTRIYVELEHSGSDPQSKYDFDVDFEIRDDQGMEITSMPDGRPLVTSAPLVGVLECDSADMDTPVYTHKLLGIMTDPSIPAESQATVCVDVLLSPGQISITATVNFHDATLTDTRTDNDCGTAGNNDCKSDMNSGNNMRTGNFEILNMGPTAYLTMETADDVDSLIDGSHLSFSVRVEHLNQPDDDFDGNAQDFLYTWTMATGMGMPSPTVPNTCLVDTCEVHVEAMHVGLNVISVTVTDYWGTNSTASYSFEVWNNYSTTDSGDCWDVDYMIYFEGNLQYNLDISDSDDVTGVKLGDSSSNWDSVCTFDMTFSESLTMPNDVSSESLTVTVDADPSKGHSLWRQGATSWVELAGTTQTQVDGDTIQLSWQNDGTLPSRPSGIYGVFASASIGQPPQAGIDSLTSTVEAGGTIELTWNINNSQLLSENDVVVLYVNDNGSALDGTGTSFATDADQIHTITGVHGTTYNYLVRVENGEMDSEDNLLYGTPVASGSATSDAQVDPVAGATNLEASMQSDGKIHFMWTASDTSDVHHWLICWSPTQPHKSYDIQGMFADGSCYESADSSTMVTMDKHATSGTYLYSVSAVDSVGNLETQDSTDGLTFTDDVDPGVGGDTIGEAGAEGEIPTQAWIAIGALVLVAVVAGAFILTRGAAEGGDDEEFDY